MNRGSSSRRRTAGGIALACLAAYAVGLMAALVLSAPIDMPVQLPAYGYDRITIGTAGAILIGLGALFAVLGAWLASIGAWKNGSAAILLGCAAPQFVTGSPVSLVLSLPTFVGAIIVAVLLSRSRRAG
jgi:hypothetical protein